MAKKSKNDWQPIEAVPKDRCILVYMPELQAVVEVIFDPDAQRGVIVPDEEWDDEDYPWVDSFGDVYPTRKFSHWMERPNDPPGMPPEDTVWRRGLSSTLNGS